MKLRILFLALLGLVQLPAFAAMDTQTAATKSQQNQTPAQLSSPQNSQKNSSSTASSISSDRDKVSYTIGVDLGKNFKQRNVDVNPEMIMQGLNDALNDKPLQMTQEEMQQTLQVFQKQLRKNREDAMKQLADKNKQAEDSFFSDNKTKKDIVTLPSGLQYKVVTQGTGAKPSMSDIVTVEYTGKLLNGTVFDSTDKMGKPVSFRVSDVIPGWSEVLQLMGAGSTWEVYIPSNLAYGDQGIGGLIGPNEALVFSIHLIDVKKGEQAATQPAGSAMPSMNTGVTKAK